MTLEAARDRVDVRFARLEAVTRESDGTAPHDSIPLLCSGTDVVGPALESEISLAVAEGLRMMSSTACDCEGSAPPVFNCASPTVLAGLLVRTFWLGYELGTEAS